VCDCSVCWALVVADGGECGLRWPGFPRMVTLSSDGYVRICGFEVRTEVA